MLLVNELLVYVILSVIVAMASNGLIFVGPAYVFIVKGAFAMPTGVIVPFVGPNSGLSFITNLSI